MFFQVPSSEFILFQLFVLFIFGTVLFQSDKPSPISLEPMFGSKSAVLSLIIQLPCGDEDYTPPGQTGLCVGSALVTLGTDAIIHHKCMIIYNNCSLILLNLNLENVIFM